MEVREQIISGAGNLFTRYGVRSVTMDDIARDLAVSKKTIYQHFKDKDEIVTLATTAHMDKEKQEFRDIADTAINAIDEIAKVSGCLRRNVSEINPSLLFDLQKYHRKAWDVYMEFKNEFIRNTIVENLKRGIEEGYYREEIDAETIAMMRVEQVELAFDDRKFPRSKFDFREVQMQFFDHFVHGVITEKGRILYGEYQKNTNNN